MIKLNQSQQNNSYLLFFLKAITLFIAFSMMYIAITNLVLPSRKNNVTAMQKKSELQQLVITLSEYQSLDSTTPDFAGRKESLLAASKDSIAKIESANSAEANESSPEDLKRYLVLVKQYKNFLAEADLISKKFSRLYGYDPSQDFDVLKPDTGTRASVAARGIQQISDKLNEGELLKTKITQTSQTLSRLTIAADSDNAIVAAELLKTIIPQFHALKVIAWEGEKAALNSKLETIRENSKYLLDRYR